MRCSVLGFVLFSISFACLTLAGCDGNKAAQTSAPAAPTQHAEHDHASEGPHHGELIELGKEEYHAELLHDDATHTITVYVLDSTAKLAVPIEAQELKINLVASGKPQQFSLRAKPDAQDPTPLSSCFALVSEALCEALDDPTTTGRINLEIKGKAFVGRLSTHAHGAAEKK